MEATGAKLTPVNRVKPHPPGYTLIELMVAVAIVALLSLLAVSSYRSVGVRGDRASAISDIVAIAQALERYFSFNHAYTNDFAELAMANSATYTLRNKASLYDYYIAIPSTTAVDELPQGAKKGLSYKIFAKPTPANRDNWVLAYDQSGIKTRFAERSTRAQEGWP